MRALILLAIMLLRRLAHFFGTLGIKAEKQYYDLTERERT